MESKEFSWKLVIADELLSRGPCELLYAHLVPSGATTNSSLYDGQNTLGEKIVTLVEAVVTGLDFRPAQPVYCRRGLYVDVGSSVTGIFVQWRELRNEPE